MTETRAVTFLNERGDTTFVWTPDADKRMVELIRKKMKEGVTFFIIEPRLFGFLPPKKTELKRPADAKKGRALMVSDEDFLAMIEGGVIETAKTPDQAPAGERISRSATEVASAQSVAVRPSKGG